MKWNTDWFNIARGIGEHCANMRNRILVSHDYIESPTNTVGTAFFIDFRSYNANPGQFTIITDEDDPLTGDVDITYTSTTIQEYGKNLVFYPIPFEMLETFESKP